MLCQVTRLNSQVLGFVSRALQFFEKLRFDYRIPSRVAKPIVPSHIDLSVYLAGEPTGAPLIASAKPGLAPVGWPESQVSWPLTKTFSMPEGSSKGFSNGERSM